MRKRQWGQEDEWVGVLVETPTAARARAYRRVRGAERYIPPVSLDLLGELARLPPPALVVGLLLVRESALNRGIGALRIPSRIAEEMGVDRRTILRGIAALESAGLVVVDRRPGRPHQIQLEGVLAGKKKPRLSVVEGGE